MEIDLLSRNDVMNHVDCVIKPDVIRRKRIHVLKISVVHVYHFCCKNIRGISKIYIMCDIAWIFA